MTTTEGWAEELRAEAARDRHYDLAPDEPEPDDEYQTMHAVQDALFAIGAYDEASQ